MPTFTPTPETTEIRAAQRDVWRLQLELALAKAELEVAKAKSDLSLLDEEGDS